MRALRKVGSLTEAGSLRRGSLGGDPSEKRNPPQKWGVPSEKRVFADKGVHALEAVPSQKRKPQRSPGHRKPGTRHQRRRPLTHRSCLAPPQAAAGPQAVSGGEVGSGPLGSHGGSSLRWRPRWRLRRRRQDDGRTTD